jgi:formyltetrahydrofolate-dependent phosphoribosylglycinamide formyltransferase
MRRVAVFASGGGTTLQALMDHVGRTMPPWAVSLVVSDRPEVGALERAAAAGIPAAVVPVSGRAAAEVASETLEVLGRHGTDLVVLAGYLRLVPERVVAAFEGRMLNIHPALLPSFGGKGMYGDRVHRAVLDSGTRLTGPTVHLVNDEYDRGRPLAQWPVPVLPGDSLETLRDRVQQVERALYPLVVDHVVREAADDLGPSPLRLAQTAFGAEPGQSDEEIRSIIHKSIAWPTAPDAP